MQDPKKISVDVKFEQGSVIGQGALDLDQDGKPALSVKLTVDVKEAAGEIFQRQSGEGKKFALSGGVTDDLKVAFSAKVDTDGDGQAVAVVYGELDLMELPSETIAAVAKKKGLIP